MNTEILNHYRLTTQEYQLIKKYLGSRAPSHLELALFSALWSEHCSYKSSAVHLKKFFFKSPLVLSGLGENAGVIDVGEGEKVAFKIESHNHPSQITPYHGAGTGVGGILRDIFVMNARPLALANYLCFGDPDAPRMEELVDGVVQGIGAYGNSIGIPMITGRTDFHSSYNQNIIVNALALGYLGPGEEIITSQAKGAENLLVYVGARTGRDGIHGASMASESFQSSEEGGKKTCVQIGDPFYGKQLMEACLEAMGKKHIIACQDMGAAGIISSSFELVSKGNLGMSLYLDKVPLRDSTMSAEDILLSESQERALLLVHPDQYSAMESIFQKHGLCVCSIGNLKKENTVEIFWEDKCLVKINPDYLTKKAPRYKRPYSSWKAIYKIHFVEDTIPCLFKKKDSWSSALLSLLSDVRVCDKSFIYRQYDNRVGTNTVKGCSFAFGALRLPASGRALGLCLGGRPHVMRMDSYEGGKDAVFEPALQLALRGFSPLALTDGLNFGNPEKPEVMSSFVACIEGMALASKSLKTPVVSGNVSLYNETGQEGISPTPAVGMVGIKKNLSISKATGFLKSDIDSDTSLQVFLVQAPMLFSKGLIGELYGERYAFFGSIDCKKMHEFIHLLLKTVNISYPHSSFVVGKMGLAFSLAQFLVGGEVGMEIDIQKDDLFQERLYEVVLVLKKEQTAIWEKNFGKPSFFKIKKIGKIISEPVFYLNDASFSLDQLKKTYTTGFAKNFPNLR